MKLELGMQRQTNGVKESVRKLGNLVTELNQYYNDLTIAQAKIDELRLDIQNGDDSCRIRLEVAIDDARTAATVIKNILSGMGNIDVGVV